MTKKYWIKVLIVFIFVSAICAGIIAGAVYSKNKRQASIDEGLVESGDIVSGDYIWNEDIQTSGEQSEEIEEIYELVKDGTPIEIMP
jgi:hypothetical protein